MSASHGRQPARITSATAIQPTPAVMPVCHVPSTGQHEVRTTDPGAEAADRGRRYRMRTTCSPAASAAAGSSPTAARATGPHAEWYDDAARSRRPGCTVA